jgi:hypothetical protein
VTETINSSYAVGNSTAVSPHETLTFRDGTPQWTTGIPSGYEDTRKQGMEMQPSLQDFFKRPVEILLAEWVPGSATPYSAIVNPWGNFWQNKRVVNRIAGYKLLQCTMKVKIMINGNAFYYGQLMADYVPLINSNTVDTTNTLNRAALVQASQRSHLYINPTKSTGGEMSLPFIWYYNSLDTVISQWNELGRLFIREINPLKHANGATTNVTLSMYVWAENVEMSAPTSSNPSTITTQAGDEYSSSPVSNMASAVADAAGKMSGYPMIGPYAKATQMMSGGISGMAKLLGYSRPAQIQDSTPVRPKIISRMANTDCGDGPARLTVDSKQELTIDPSVVGVNEMDSMTIKSIATRESYLTTFTWAVNSVDNTRLWNTRVQPTLCVGDSTFTPAMTWMPACAFASFPFKYWRGTMRFRFQIVCSDYHRGRLKFVYDPSFVPSTPEANLGFTRLVDLEKERDFVMDIGMAQSRSFLPVGDIGNAVSAYNTTAISSEDPTANGILGVFVATELTTPNSSINNDIQINVFVSTCDDIDYAEPTSSQIIDLTYSTQAGEEAQPEVSAPISETSDEKAVDCLVTDHTHDIHFGETYQSFRALLKRYAYQGTWLCPTAGDNIWTLTFHNFPYYRGRFTNAVNVDSTAAKSNLVQTNLLTYLTPAYLAVRGSMRWKYMYASDKDANVAYFKVSRSASGAVTTTNVATVPISTNNNTYMVYKESREFNGLEGIDVTYNKAQPVLEFEVPYYSNARFMVAKDLQMAVTPVCTQYDRHRLIVDNHNTAISYIDRYVSTGEDFSLVLFQGAPPVKHFTLAAV